MARLVSMGTIRSAYGPGEGRHWFDPSTMRFFRCRLPANGYRAEHGDGFYFVSSEQGPDGVRAYTVREMRRESESEPYSIEDRGGFQAYGSRAVADRVAFHLALSSGAPATFQSAPEVAPR